MTDKSEDEVFAEVLLILRPQMEGYAIADEVLRSGFGLMCIMFPLKAARDAYLDLVQLLLCKLRFYDPSTVVKISGDIFYDLAKSGLLHSDAGGCARVSGKLCKRVFALAVEYCELMFKGGLEVLKNAGPLEVQCEGCNFRAFIATLPGGILYLDTCEQCGDLQIN